MSKFYLRLSLVLSGCFVVVLLTAQTIGALVMASSVIVYRSWGGESPYLIDLEYSIALPIKLPNIAGTSLSSDGHWLAYVLNEGERDIYVMNLETGASQNFTNNHSYAYFYNPISWSPDGRWLAFVSNLNGEDTDVYVLNFQSGVLRQLTDNDVHDDEVAWSSDSQLLSYIEDPLGIAPQIRLINVDSGTIESFWHDNVLYLTWSNNGRWIAYTQWIENNLDVLAVDLMTGESINLSNHPAWDGVPAFSPQGDWLAFTSDRNGNRDIYLLNIVTNELMNATPDSVSDDSPRWSSDGRWLLFSSEYIGTRALNIETGKMISLLNRHFP